MPPAVAQETNRDEGAAARHWSDRIRPWQACLLLLLSGLWYAPVLFGESPPFTYDDLPSLVDSPNVRSLTPLKDALGAPPGSGASGRPLVALSLALNYAAGGLNPRAYHLVNVLVHVAAALALFALARRVILMTRGSPTEGIAPTFAALALALPWVAHPLHTMSALNVVYRNESMVGLFYLLTLLAALASFTSPRQAPAIALALVACLLGTASKEVIVTAPLVVLLFDAVLVSRSPWRALRNHRWLYIALALCWIPLACFVIGGDRGESVGFGLQGFGPLDYLRTQAGVLPHYLRLILWPHPLVLDYGGWPVARTWSQALLPGGAVIVVLVLAIALLARRRLVGAIAVSAFLVLAPTSTIIPLSGALVGEHRTYLVIAAVLALIGIATARGLGRLGLSREQRTQVLASASALATLGLGASTVARQGDYQRELGIWRDTVEKRPDNPRAWSSLGVVYASRGELDAAESAYRQALELSPRHYRTHINLGNLHLDRGALAQAAEDYARAFEARPDLAEPNYYAGTTQVALGNPRAGIPHLRRALELDLDPRLLDTCRIELAWALATAHDEDLRAGPEALRLAREAQSDPPRARDLDVLAAALAQDGEFEQAVEVLQPLIERLGAGIYAQELRSRLREYRAGRPWRD